MSNPEHLLLQGADNFRSLKGMPTRCGRRIGGHTLLRADQLHRLTAEDWQTLQRIGLKTLCDLRSAGEREHYPSRLPDSGMHLLHLEVIGDLRADPQIAAMLADNPAEEGARCMMLEVYRQLPGMLAPRLSALFERLSGENASVLIHCAAGKDRTGVAVMLLLHALGVAPEHIMADYLRSARRFSQLDAERQEAMSNTVSRMVGQPVSESAIDAVLDARPEYLNAAYAVIEAEYGGVDCYLQRFSGLSTERLQRLRDTLLVA
ncbi:tyrosine-protein phosphatase [Pseudomonas sp. FSL W5-0299]|jgi:protein-tyrosine phosphatase|uniref:tyrosine-protein phosphatase n=1 Tax=Pseudomonas sp. FSL W5-0299 TaxID=1917484 RepID=UPI000989E5A0|nr:tyrosine-protein phosphatase [Pseudomonas sp. FSL W5-0299]OOL38302.1 protein tyrosine phosphatase [Pseudomonas sp. FSL W5-0299]